MIDQRRLMKIALFATNGSFVVAVERATYGENKQRESATVLTPVSPILDNVIYTAFFLFATDKSSNAIIQRFQDAGKVAPDAIVTRVYTPPHADLEEPEDADRLSLP